MKVPSFNLNSVKNLAHKFVKNLSWLFFAAFLLLILFEILEINSSLQIILAVDQESTGIISDKGVRINFKNYNLVVDRIEHSDSFEPTGGITKNPFYTQ